MWARKRIHYLCEGEIEKPVPHFTVCHHSASLVMPNGDPRDGIFFPNLKLMMDYIIVQVKSFLSMVFLLVCLWLCYLFSNQNVLPSVHYCLWCYVYTVFQSRTLVKSAQKNDNFLISQPKHIYKYLQFYAEIFCLSKPVLNHYPEYVFDTWHLQIQIIPAGESLFNSSST